MRVPYNLKMFRRLMEIEYMGLLSMLYGFNYSKLLLHNIVHGYQLDKVKNTFDTRKLKVSKIG